MSAKEVRELIDAIGCTVVFVLFCGLLLTAPTWGKWLDELGDEPHRVNCSDAERHVESYVQLKRGQ